MPNTSAIGVTVRHAVTRALATANLAPHEATYRVLSARAWARRDGSVGRAEVFLHIAAPRPMSEWEAQQADGWVNPDGEHPDMVLVRLADPLFVDLFPVTWDSWLAVQDESLPERIDPLVARVGVSLEEARSFARRVHKRLPTAAEFRALWGPARYPWGEERDPALGRHEPPRFDEVHEVGAHPPQRGVYDLGAWLGHMLDDGTVAGVLHQARPAFGVPLDQVRAPVGFRCVCES